MRRNSISQSESYSTLSIEIDLHEANPEAQLVLRETGVIGKRSNKSCPLSVSMQHVFGDSVRNVKWKKLLGTRYEAQAVKAAQLRGYSEADATAWVNLVDALHDNLLESLFQHEKGALGNYVKIGTALNDVAQYKAFHAKYPETRRAFKMIHDARYESALSHPVNFKTKRPTRFIEFKFINKVKSQLIKAYVELWNKW